MSGQKNQLVVALSLIGLGLLLLVANISRVGMDILWPIFPLAVGAAFWFGYFNNRKNVGLLMPGSILVIIGLLFFYCAVFGWWHMEMLWPVFILAPAAGFFAMYTGGLRDNGLLIVGGILAAIGFIFLFANTRMADFWPLILIIAGIILVARHSGFLGKRSDQPPDA